MHTILFPKLYSRYKGNYCIFIILLYKNICIPDVILDSFFEQTIGHLRLKICPPGPHMRGFLFELSNFITSEAFSAFALG